MLPRKLDKILENRKADKALRELTEQSGLVDFSSNDYLGFSKSETIFQNTFKFLKGHNIIQNGATGSRLLSGNNRLFNVLESILCEFHNSESALVFNSGYDANIGFFSCVPQRGDIILYDEFIHASIRDGIKMSNANSFKFQHNNLEHLEALLERYKNTNHAIYVVTESVFSMDGDSPDFKVLTNLCDNKNIFLIIDEAHATGVFGEKGQGLIQMHGLEDEVFARIVTFGKAIGCHGAAILGSNDLRTYLINFSRPFIYTTALAPHSIASVHSAYNELITTDNRQKLLNNITYFKRSISINNLDTIFIASNSAIHCCIIQGNQNVKGIANKLNENNFNVKPILAPTVPKGEERLRFCLHSYNTQEEISEVLGLLATLINS